MRFQWIALLAITSLVACSAPDKDDDDNNGWELNNNNGIDGGETDGGTDMGGSDTGPPPDGGIEDMGEPDMGGGGQPVQFRLVNASDQPVFAYNGRGANNPCGLGSWVEVLQDGESQLLEDDCTLCKCSEPECAVCAFDCAPGADPDYAQIAPNTERSFTWDGLFRVRQSDGDGGTCYADQTPTSDTLTARFCWGYAFDLTSNPWGEINEIECRDVEFAVDDDVVEVEIFPTAREQVQFELRNSSSQTLFAAVGVDSPCEVDEWLQLSQGDQKLTLSPPCGPCICSEIGDDSMCPVPCPAISCAQPMAEFYEFAPGDVRSLYWNRVAYFDDVVDGTQCLDPRLVAGELTAELCWATGFDDATYQLTGRQCETIVFDPYVDTRVAHEIVDAP